MKNYSLGFVLDEDTVYKVRKVVGEVGRVFQGQDIPISWFPPSYIFVEVMNFGYSLNFLKKFFLEKTISKLIISPIDISLNRCEVGISRKYKELVYLSVDKGGDRLRELVFNLRKILKTKDFSNYIPRVSIGRINKDITDQEITNLKADLLNVGEGLNITDINFKTKELALLVFENNQATILKKFETSK